MKKFFTNLPFKPSFLLFIFSLTFPALVLFSNEDAVAFENITFVKDISAGLKKPIDVTLSKSGDIYVLDQDASRVLVFDPTGKPKSEFGNKGSKIGQLKSPQSITISQNNIVVVADTGNNRIQLFNARGEFIRQFGTSGSKPGQLKKPSGVAIDRFGFIYVADQGNNRVQVFSEKGIFLMSFSTKQKPLDLSLDPLRNVYVLVPAGKKVLKFSARGKKLGEISGSIQGNDYFSNATGIGVDRRGDIYLSDGREESIKKLDSAKKLLLSFGSEGDGRGQFESPAGIYCDENNSIYIADTKNSRIQVFTVTGTSKQEIPPVLKSPPIITFDSVIEAENGVTDVLLNPSKGLYTLSDAKDHILIQGEKNDLFGKSGNKKGQFKKPQEMAIGAKGNIFIADTGNNRVQVLNPDGTFQYAFGKQGKKNSQFSNPAGVAVNSKGILYVSDTGNHRVQIFNKDMIFLSSFGEKTKKAKNDKKKAPPAKGTFLNPNSLTIDSLGNLYIVDSGNNRVQVFDEDGRFLKVIGQAGTEVGEMQNPIDIAIDEEGFLFVADKGNSRIQVFDGKGDFILAFGAPGKEKTSFSEISGISARKGKVYISDHKRNYVQVFRFHPNGIFQEDRIYQTRTVFPHPDLMNSSVGKETATNEAIQSAIRDLAEKMTYSVEHIKKFYKKEVVDYLSDGRVKVTISIPKSIPPEEKVDETPVVEETEQFELL